MMKHGADHALYYGLDVYTSKNPDSQAFKVSLAVNSYSATHHLSECHQEAAGHSASSEVF